MRSFDEILAIAAERKGGADKVLSGIVPPKSTDEIAAIPDDRWLAQFARGIFQAGISWKVVEAKWPGIEDAFHGFDVGRVSMIADDDMDALLSDTRVIRSGPKIQAVIDNAVFIRSVSAEHGGFGRHVADWPAEDFGGLVDWLTKNGARLGGNTGPYALRQMGKDGYILSRDVVARLVAEGVVDKAPTSARAKRAVQDAFNTWAAQSGKPLTVISRVLAQSIDATD